MECRTYTTPEHGISKEEAVGRLRENGYDAVFEHSLVSVALPFDNYPRKREEVIAFFNEIDYRMSFSFSRTSPADR